MIATASLTRLIRALRATCCTVGLIAVVGGAAAAEMTITAEFRPSALDPGRKTFTNTTPPGAVLQLAARLL